MRRNRKIAVWALLAVVVLALGRAVLTRGHKGTMSSMAASTQGKALYQCPMHPTIVSSKPDNCPICGMRLEKVTQAPSASSQKAAGVGPTGSKGRGKILYYRHPMRADITSPKPAKDEMGMDYIPIHEGEETTAQVSSIPGHAEIFVAPERQQLIGIQTAVVEERPLSLAIRAVGRVAYDPELYSFLTEYKEALAAQQKMMQSPMPEIREQGDSLVRAARLKLKLLGLSDAQIDGLMKSGEGTTNLLLSSDVAWVYADIYEYETSLVKPGQAAQITTPALPGKRFEGQIRSVDAVLNAMSRTLRARIEVPNAEKLLKPEMFVDVILEAELGTKLAIPENAVIDTGRMQWVFVDKGEGRLDPREVQVGYDASGYYEVLSGLSPGEKVVSSANFLIDSESRLRSAAQGFAGAKKEETASKGTSSTEMPASSSAEGSHSH